jgi:hypothetical protein
VFAGGCSAVRWEPSVDGWLLGCQLNLIGALSPRNTQWATDQS